jgi:MFS family permease
MAASIDLPACDDDTPDGTSGQVVAAGDVDVAVAEAGGAPRTRPSDNLFGRGYRAQTVGFVSAVLLTAFEAMAVGTAMPVAVRELHGIAWYSLAFSAYFTTSLLGMVAAGERADAHGPRLPFLGGAACFGAGLLTAGTATSIAQFVAGRAIQGLGGGMMIVALYVVVGRVYPDRLRPRAFSLMAACWVLPSVVGPVIAGLVAQRLSWRWIFLGVAVLLTGPVMTLFGTLRRLAREIVPVPDAPRPARRTRRVWWALLVSTAAAALEYAGYDLTFTGALAAVLGVALLTPSLPRLLPRGTLRAARGLPTVILSRGLLSGCYFGIESFVPLMLVNERRLSPTLAGLSLTGAAVSWAIASWVLSRRWWRFSRTTSVRIGAAVVTVSLLGTVPAVSPAFPAATAAVTLFCAAFGMGLAFASISVLTLELSELADQGVNSAALQLSDGLGSTVMVGIGGAIFHALHVNAAHDRHVFVVIYLTMIAVGTVAVAVSTRLRPRPARAA